LSGAIAIRKHDDFSGSGWSHRPCGGSFATIDTPVSTLII
jgi:hypothetical protein